MVNFKLKLKNLAEIQVSGGELGIRTCEARFNELELELVMARRSNEEVGYEPVLRVKGVVEDVDGIQTLVLYLNARDPADPRVKRVRIKTEV